MINKQIIKELLEYSAPAIKYLKKISRGKYSDKLLNDLFRKDVKDLVRKSILPEEHPNISGLKRKIAGAKTVLHDTYKERRLTLGKHDDTKMQDVVKLVENIKHYYKSPEWKEKAMKLSGMTKEEAEEASKFYGGNPDRFIIRNDKVYTPSYKGVTILDNTEKVHPVSGVGDMMTSSFAESHTPTHEAVHMATLGGYPIDFEAMGINKPILESAVKKYNEHNAKLADELYESALKFPGIDNIPEDLNYLTIPNEVLSRMLTAKRLGYKASEVPDNIDPIRKYIDSKTYEDVYNKIYTLLPIVGGTLGTGAMIGRVLSKLNNEKTY